MKQAPSTFLIIVNQKSSEESHVGTKWSSPKVTLSLPFTWQHSIQFIDWSRGSDWMRRQWDEKWSSVTTRSTPMHTVKLLSLLSCNILQSKYLLSTSYMPDTLLHSYSSYFIIIVWIRHCHPHFKNEDMSVERTYRVSDGANTQNQNVCFQVLCLVTIWTWFWWLRW